MTWLLLSWMWVHNFYVSILGILFQWKTFSLLLQRMKRKPLTCQTVSDSCLVMLWMVLEYGQVSKTIFSTGRVTYYTAWFQTQLEQNYWGEYGSRSSWFRLKLNANHKISGHNATVFQTTFGTMLVTVVSRYHACRNRMRQVKRGIMNACALMVSISIKL